VSIRTDREEFLEYWRRSRGSTAASRGAGWRLAGGALVNLTRRTQEGSGIFRRHETAHPLRRPAHDPRLLIVASRPSARPRGAGAFPDLLSSCPASDRHPVDPHRVGRRTTANEMPSSPRPAAHSCEPRRWLRKSREVWDWGAVERDCRPPASGGRSAAHPPGRRGTRGGVSPDSPCRAVPTRRTDLEDAYLAC